VSTWLLSYASPCLHWSCWILVAQSVTTTALLNAVCTKSINTTAVLNAGYKRVNTAAVLNASQFHLFTKSDNVQMCQMLAVPQVSTKHSAVLNDSYNNVKLASIWGIFSVNMAATSNTSRCQYLIAFETVTLSLWQLCQNDS